MSESPFFSTTLRHSIRIPYFFGRFLALCLDPLSFQWLSGIMSESPNNFYSSPASSPNPQLFWWFFSIVFESPLFRHLFDIVSGSPIISMALRHRVWIPYLFDNSPTSCSHPLSFQRLIDIVSGSGIFSVVFDIMSGSPIFFDGSSTSCLDLFSFGRLFVIVSGSPIFSTALRHRVRSPFPFNGFSASCLITTQKVLFDSL